MIVKLLTEHHLAFLSLKGGCTGSSESTLAKMSNCWKSRAGAHIHSTMGYGCIPCYLLRHAQFLHTKCLFLICHFFFILDVALFGT